MTPPLITAAALGYLANGAFGAAVATGMIDNSRIRWVHHALYVVTCSLTTAALVASAKEHRAAGLALLPAAGTLTVLPRAGRSRHVRVAATAAPAYIIALVLAWRNR
ncbi:hypothetical protein ACTI_50240 [Actinoplanes sp. OR16]|uniref:hypothetical protein n=1 Tax=Actinoplanes sp. OR16 TaxID=946334 RepID=UPI000F6E8E83|nr:hypothetical protein [Actinoplanes sp. OR16]BBH68339.1 hypothetical protein ACTI_50240 [Actinoplanes sp. OR16]